MQIGEDTERFTLRLPEEFRKQVISNALLNRCGSTVRWPEKVPRGRGTEPEKFKLPDVLVPFCRKLPGVSFLW
ncbi:hypothetical protein L1987_44527 [Smallanthus sonchifolius]|uniref:Uncharacterized protein n=1 Tax=Smallanthus sonchifolius TaxID=185202 RepID=A0ACB9GP38_9ASTR|nr:hypothetical protein L1987_44527 [Smallanthus sonchifolius]